MKPNAHTSIFLKPTIFKVTATIGVLLLNAALFYLRHIIFTVEISRFSASIVHEQAYIETLISGFNFIFSPVRYLIPFIDSLHTSSIVIMHLSRFIYTYILVCVIVHFAYKRAR